MTTTLPATTTADDYDEWIATLDADPQATHRMHLRINVALDVVLPPWMSTADGLQAVGVVANRLDVDEVLARIDYTRDMFLPAGAKLDSIHGDAERLT